MRRLLVGSMAFALSLAPSAVAQTAKTPATTKKPAPKPAPKATPKTAAKPAAQPMKVDDAAHQAAVAAHVKADADAAEARAAEEAAAAAAAEAAAAETARQQAEQQQARDTQRAARGLEARMRALADTLAITLKRLPGDHRDQRFAVLPFEAVGDEAQQKSLGVVVADLLTTDLVREHRLPLVERAQLGAVMNELALQQSGAVPDAQVLEIGKTAGARAVVVGRVVDAGDTFVVTVRAIDAESGAVLAAEDTSLPKAELVAFSADAVVLKSRAGAAFRSVVVPGWGQSENGEPVKAVVVGGVVGGLALATIATVGVGAWQGYSVYPSVDKDGATSAEKSRLATETRERANVLLTAGAILGGATVVAWATNVVEAYVSGTDVESLDAALAKQ